MSKNEAIFPLAYKDDSTLYFLKALYDSNGNEIYDERVICKFIKNENKLEELPSTKGLLASNAVNIGDILYFTTYNENNDNYDLYKIKINDEIQLIDTGLVTGELYNNNGELWISNKTKIYDYEDSTMYLPKSILNYFYHQYLFQIDINNEGDLQLTLTNTETKKVENTFDKVVDVRVENDKVYIYTLEEIIVV